MQALGGWTRTLGAVVLASAIGWLTGCNSSTPQPASTQISLTSSAATINVGGSVTLTATLTGSSLSSAIGTIIFYDGSTTIAPVLLANGTASTTVTTLTPGANLLTASYSGDQSLAASTSTPVTVTAYVPTTTTVSVNPSLAGVGDQVTLTSVVAGGQYPPTGTVTFTSGGATLGTAALSNVSGVQTATLATTSLPLGVDSVTASYAANSYFLGSTSAAATVQIHTTLINTSTALVTAPTGTIAAGTPTTLTATITPVSAGATGPTGTVNFLDGATSIGSVSVANGMATLTTRQFLTGANSLTAVYSGGAVYATSASTATPLTLTAYAGATYTNPLNLSDPTTGKVYNCPDPAIIKSQTGSVDTWYAYCTGDAFNAADTVSGGAFKAHLISVFSSPDLVNWTYVRDAFSSLPSWVASGSELQTPAIKYFGGLYHLYYEAPSVAAAPNGSAIGVGTAATAAGPFTDSGGPVIGQQIACGGSCNRTVYAPEVIADSTGQEWIVYGGIYAGISIRQLNAAGTVSDPTTEINIGVDNYYQDPFLWYHDGYFYEFLTAGACCSGAFSSDNVHVGRSVSITGPYDDAEGNDMNAFSTPASVGAPGGDPVLVMNGNDIVGSGSNTIFTDESGQDYIFYSGVSKKQQYLPTITGYTARQLMMDPLDWVNGWPEARNGAGPSDYTMPQPVPAAQPNATNGYTPPFVTPDSPGMLTAAYSDDFNETTLSSQWTFLHATPTYTMTGSEYAVQSVNAESVVNMVDLPILSEPEPAGNYLMEVKLSSSDAPNGYIFNNNQGGLFIYSSDTDYLRLDQVPVFETRQIEYLNQFGPSPAYSFAPVGPPNFYASTYLRIAKRVGTNGNPNTYTAYSSMDGVTYLKGPTWTATYPAGSLIGLFAGNTIGFTASFDYIHVSTLLP